MSNSLWLHRLQHARFLVHHQLAELAQIHVHRGSDGIQPSHPLLLPSFPAFNLSQHQGLFQWVSSSHQSNHIWFDLNQIPYDYTAEVRNRFKGLELIDRVLDELRTEEKEYVKAVYCHPAYLTSMQSTSWETLGWKKHKLESRLPGGTKKPLDESERGEWKSWLKPQHPENEDHGIWSHHFLAKRCGNCDRLYLGGLQNHCRWWLQPWN